MTTSAVELHVGDVGTVFEATILEDGVAITDLADATGLEVIFERPDGTTITRTATISTPPGADGKIRYVTTAEDLTVAGDWRWQAKLTYATGTWRTSIGEFTVSPNLG